MNSRVGVVAVQGDFQKHIDAFLRLGLTDVAEVRTPEDLARVERIVIPGGESTAVGRLMARHGLGAAIQERAESGMPIWGTCMGLILMAKSVEGHEQYALGVLDVVVRRNAFGAQVHSFEDTLDVRHVGEGVTAVFIRAPVVTRIGPEVEAICHYGGQIVAVKQGNRIGTSFHPELTEDTRFHDWFLRL